MDGLPSLTTTPCKHVLKLHSVSETVPRRPMTAIVDKTNRKALTVDRKCVHCGSLRTEMYWEKGLLDGNVYEKFKVYADVTTSGKLTPTSFRYLQNHGFPHDFVPRCETLLMCISEKFVPLPIISTEIIWILFCRMACVELRNFLEAYPDYLALVGLNLS